jgi:cytochrome c biogenesis protein CcmG/thiol:disulfide interchange protein DsbE
MSRRWLIFLPPALFGLLAGLFLAGMFRDDPDGLPSTLVGRPAPPLALTALGDTPLLTDAALRGGGPVLVNFWASWCAPCRAEHPILVDLAAEGIPVHGVNVRDDPAKALAFLAELGNPYATVGADRTGRAALAWGTYGVPETFVLDGAGRVVLRYAGPITREILEQTIRPGLAAAGS